MTASTPVLDLEDALYDLAHGTADHAASEAYNVSGCCDPGLERERRSG